MAFANFKPVSMADQPDYMTAQALDEQSKANARALRNKDIMGGISLYNEGMGDSTPIGDYMSEAGSGISDYMGWGGEAAAVPEMIAAPGVGTMSDLAPAGMDGMLAELMNPASQSLIGAGEGALAPIAGETVANLALPTAAESLTASALGTEALGIGAGALAPAAGAAGAASLAGTVLPPLGIAMLLSSLFG